MLFSSFLSSNTTTTVGCGQKTKIIPFSHQVFGSGSISSIKMRRMVWTFVQNHTTFLHCQETHVIWNLFISVSPLRVPIFFLTILPLWFISEVRLDQSHWHAGLLSPTEKHHRVSLVTVLLCCFIHMNYFITSLKRLNLTLNSFLSFLFAFACKISNRSLGKKERRLGQLQSQSSAIIWSKNRKLLQML